MQFVTPTPDPETDPEHVNPGKAVIVCWERGKRSGRMSDCKIAKNPPFIIIQLNFITQLNHTNIKTNFTGDVRTFF